MNPLLQYLIKSDYIKAQILAFTRHAVTTIGAGLVVHGYASSGMIESASGLICMAISFYLSQKDVKTVDEKITVALHTPTPEGLTPEQEVEVTRLLNKLQVIKPGMVK